MNLSLYKNIVVLGAGESGTGAAVLAATKGFNVFLSDSGLINPEFKNELENHHISFEENQHTVSRILKADLIIKSPGIPEKAPIMMEIRKKKIMVISEIEFAIHFINSKIIGVTGSNGKTTTTMLIYHLLKSAGMNVCYAGNIGVGLARRVLENEYDYFVTELSSFQLDDIVDFKSHIAILLNITPDHLDRYHYNLEEYAFSKFNVIRNQTEKDFFIYDMDDEITMKYLDKFPTPATAIPISQISKPLIGAYIEDNDIMIKLNNNKIITIPMNILTLVGKHNKYNSMAAAAAAFAVDIQDADLRKSLSDFQNIAHRLEFVSLIHGREFINDSKATNVNATWYALESMNKPIVWIVGGIDKGNNYEEIKPLVQSKVKAIICLGEDNKKIIEAFSDIHELIFETTSMSDAVEIAYRLAGDNEVILLSPACASFDLFKSYEDRGNQFKEAVRNL